MWEFDREFQVGPTPPLHCATALLTFDRRRAAPQSLQRLRPNPAAAALVPQASGRGLPSVETLFVLS